MSTLIIPNVPGLPSLDSIVGDLPIRATSHNPGPQGLTTVNFSDAGATSGDAGLFSTVPFTDALIIGKQVTAYIDGREDPKAWLGTIMGVEDYCILMSGGLDKSQRPVASTAIFPAELLSKATQPSGGAKVTVDLIDERLEFRQTFQVSPLGIVSTASNDLVHSPEAGAGAVFGETLPDGKLSYFLEHFYGSMIEAAPAPTSDVETDELEAPTPTLYAVRLTTGIVGIIAGVAVGIAGAAQANETVGLAGGTIAYGSFVKLLDWWADRPADGGGDGGA